MNETSLEPSRLLADTPEPDTVSFNSLLSGLAQSCQTGLAVKHFNSLKNVGLRPLAFPLSSLVKVCDGIEENVKRRAVGREVFCGVFRCGQCGLNGDEGEQIHGYGVKIGLLVRFSVHLTNAIMTMYSGCVSKVDVVKVLSAIASCGLLIPGEQVQAVCLKADLEQGILIRNLVLKTGFGQDSYVQSAVTVIAEAMAMQRTTTGNLASWNTIGGSIQYLFARDSSHPESEEMHMELTRLSEHMSMTPEWEEDGVGWNLMPLEWWLNGLLYKARSFSVRRGSGQHGNYGMDSGGRNSRLYLTPLWERPFATETLGHCSIRNITQRVIHHAISRQGHTLFLHFLLQLFSLVLNADMVMLSVTLEYI
ncbi:hypothetical protein TIFTF001_003477 [Ficus carica]|uniref:Uncharacterized protein n=1 Tax=Ficus carica TaxID=3494 RepID=A0AA87ZG04_FICCA|nr:hypothetical protein TIFTF001_003477 [Ficus carica]